MVRTVTPRTTGETGLARSIHALRKDAGLERLTLGEIKSSITYVSGKRRAWLAEAAVVHFGGLDTLPDAPPPTVVLPLDQAEELFGADVGEEACAFLELAWRAGGRPGSERTRHDRTFRSPSSSDRYETDDICPRSCQRFRRTCLTV